MPRKTLATVKKTEVSAANYTKFLTSLKAKIRSAQIKEAIAVNQELIKLYWDIGKDIVEKREEDGWGSKVLERVAKDLQNDFPGGMVLPDNNNRSFLKKSSRDVHRRTTRNMFV